MKKLFLSILLFLGIITASSAAQNLNCFIAKEGEKVLMQEGNSCNEPNSPCSSFKIAIALMNFNDGILQDGSSPALNYKDYEGLYAEPMSIQALSKGSLNPQSWMQQSAVWYSQAIMAKLSIEKFQYYVDAFHYGNQDISGDRNPNGQSKNNGLSRAWLSSSLKISPVQQIDFLQKYILNKNDVVSDMARQKTKNILLYDVSKVVGIGEADKDKYNGEQWKGWKLYGKTGTGNFLKADNSHDETRPFGWFVGWIEKGNRQIVFASFIGKNEKASSPVSFDVREKMRVKLLEIIDIVETK